LIVSLAVICTVLLREAATAEPVQVLEYANLESSDYPPLGLVIVEAGLFKDEDEDLYDFPKHDFAFSQTLMASVTAWGSTHKSTALLVRPKASEIYSSGTNKSFHVTGVDEGGTQTGPVILKVYGMTLRWRVSSFPLPFAFNVGSQKILPSALVESCRAELCTRGQYGEPDATCNRTWQWQDSTAEQDASLTMHTCNSNMSNFSWPSGNFFLVAAPLPSLEPMRHQVEAAVMSWNQSLNNGRVFSTEATGILADEVRGNLLYQGDEFSRLADKLESAIPAGTWVNLNKSSQVRFSPSWCKGEGCSSDRGSNILSIFNILSASHHGEIEIAASTSSQARTFSGFEDDSGFNYCENQGFAVQGSANSRMMFNPRVEVRHGSLPYTFTNAVANILSYGHTGWSIMSFLFPTMISLPFLFSFGRRYAAYKDAIQELGNLRMEAEIPPEMEDGGLERAFTNSGS
jgi:hypothetical protein